MVLLATVSTGKQLAPGDVLAGTGVMATVSTPPTPLLAPRHWPSGGESTALVMQRMPPCVVIVAAADVNATTAAASVGAVPVAVYALATIGVHGKCT